MVMVARVRRGIFRFIVLGRGKQSQRGRRLFVGIGCGMWVDPDVHGAGVAVCPSVGGDGGEGKRGGVARDAFGGDDRDATEESGAMFGGEGIG